MSIKIITDSTCDLPPSVIAQYDITVIPLYINIGTQGYRDGIDLSRQDFYEQLLYDDPHPTTAAPSPEVLRQKYEQLAEQGATEILSIHISSSLSATANVARLAARETTSVPVTVFDSKQLSLGTGFLVQTAAKAVAEGHSMQDILPLLNEQISRTHIFAILDTLEFLCRSGRMNTMVAGLASWFKIKALLKMYDGQATSERIRTRKRATQRLITLLRNVSPLEKVALLHANAPDKAETLRQQVQDLLPEQEILSVNITPVIGAHVGPGTVGLACISCAT